MAHLVSSTGLLSRLLDAFRPKSKKAIEQKVSLLPKPVYYWRGHPIMPAQIDCLAFRPRATVFTWRGVTFDPSQMETVDSKTPEQFGSWRGTPINHAKIHRHQTV